MFQEYPPRPPGLRACRGNNLTSYPSPWEGVYPFPTPRWKFPPKILWNVTKSKLKIHKIIQNASPKSTKICPWEPSRALLALCGSWKEWDPAGTRPFGTPKGTQKWPQILQKCFWTTQQACEIRKTWSSEAHFYRLNFFASFFASKTTSFSIICYYVLASKFTSKSMPFLSYFQFSVHQKPKKAIL